MAANLAVGNSIRHRSPPAWPALMLGFCAVMATLSLAQGVVDIVLPAIQGDEPFGFLFLATEKFGPNFLFGYIFVHNLGLACLVPGIGFVAAWFEKKTSNRALIGWILAGAVATSLLVTLLYIIQAHERFDLRVALPIYLGEAAAVLAVAIAGVRELRGFVPTRTYQWALITPFRRMAFVLGATTMILAALATLETWILLGGASGA